MKRPMALMIVALVLVFARYSALSKARKSSSRATSRSQPPPVTVSAEEARNERWDVVDRCGRDAEGGAGDRHRDRGVGHRHEAAFQARRQRACRAGAGQPRRSRRSGHVEEPAGAAPAGRHQFRARPAADRHQGHLAHRLRQDRCAAEGRQRAGREDRGGDRAQAPARALRRAHRHSAARSRTVRHRGAGDRDAAGAGHAGSGLLPARAGTAPARRAGSACAAACRPIRSRPSTAT